MAKKAMEFEEAMEELESVIKKLEMGELSLEQSVEHFKKGMELAGFLNKRLNEVEKKISVIIQDAEGNLKEELF